MIQMATMACPGFLPASRQRISNLLQRILSAPCIHPQAVAMDDPLAYDSGPAQPAGMNAYCSSMARDAAAWGTLPSALCAPYGPPMYWSGPTGAYPYFYGRPSGRTWRGPGWHQYRGYSGRGYGGGWRGGRGGGRR